MKIVSIGEILWDVYKNEEHIGGAPFNFSVHVNRLGHEVYTFLQHFQRFYSFGEEVYFTRMWEDCGGCLTGGAI